VKETHGDRKRKTSESTGEGCSATGSITDDEATAAPKPRSHKMADKKTCLSNMLSEFLREGDGENYTPAYCKKDCLCVPASHPLTVSI